MLVIVIVPIVTVMITVGGGLARRLGGHGMLMPGIGFQAAKNGVRRRLSVDQCSDRWNLFVRLKSWSRRQRLARRVFVVGGLLRCRTRGLASDRSQSTRRGKRAQSCPCFVRRKCRRNVRCWVRHRFRGIRLPVGPRAIIPWRIGRLGRFRWFLRYEVGCRCRLERRSRCRSGIWRRRGAECRFLSRCRSWGWRGFLNWCRCWFLDWCWCWLLNLRRRGSWFRGWCGRWSWCGRWRWSWCRRCGSGFGRIVLWFPFVFVLRDGKSASESEHDGSEPSFGHDHLSQSHQPIRNVPMTPPIPTPRWRTPCRTLAASDVCQLPEALREL